MVTTQQLRTMHPMFRVVAKLDPDRTFDSEQHVKQWVKNYFGAKSIKDLTQEQVTETMMTLDLYLLEKGITPCDIERELPNVMEYEKN